MKKKIFSAFFFCSVWVSLVLFNFFFIVQWKFQISVLHFNVSAFFMMWKLNSAPAKSQETTLLTIFQKWGITYVLKMKIRSMFRSSVCFMKHSTPHFITSLVNPPLNLPPRYLKFFSKLLLVQGRGFVTQDWNSILQYEDGIVSFSTRMTTDHQSCLNSMCCAWGSMNSHFKLFFSTAVL